MDRVILVARILHSIKAKGMDDMLLEMLKTLDKAGIVSVISGASLWTSKLGWCTLLKKKKKKDQSISSSYRGIMYIPKPSTKSVAKFLK